jgi:hypothetical protein
MFQRKCHAGGGFVSARLLGYGPAGIKAALSTAELRAFDS